MALRAALYLADAILDPLVANGKRERCVRYAATEGISLVGLYEDYGQIYQEAITARPAGSRLMEDISQGKFHIVLTGDARCISLDFEEMTSIASHLATCGVVLRVLEGGSIAANGNEYAPDEAFEVDTVNQGSKMGTDMLSHSLLP